MKKRFLASSISLVMVGFSGLTIVQAASNGLVAAPTNIISSPDQVIGLFCGAMNWMFWGLIILAVVMFLVGGYRYATSSGEAEKVGKANKTLLYAAIAVVVGLFAAGIPYLIGNFFGTSIGNACVGSAPANNVNNFNPPV